MLIHNQPYQTIWLNEKNAASFFVIDQRRLPHELVIKAIQTSEQAAVAIETMMVRGAPLIGVTAAYGLYLAMLEAGNNNFDIHVEQCKQRLEGTRPTAVNLKWALQQVMAATAGTNTADEKRMLALTCANQIKKEDIEMCRMIGVHGLDIIRQLNRKKNGAVVNILTHCNAGWLACVDWGTATSPMYHAQQAGIPIHVWVDETRPRNQGANLTAFELGQQGIAHTLITDNTGGHLMQHGMVDMVIAGADRVAANGDVANKIGTYLKALAARDNNIPFYAALPQSTIDWNIQDGIAQIPVEQRNENEVKYVSGLHNGEIKEVLICPADTPACNYGFDVTPARLITGIITEKGVTTASEEGLKKLYRHDG
jgi:methylthioribose-1-phosphate isomerase